jgi:hypothetical protein
MPSRLAIPNTGGTPVVGTMGLAVGAVRVDERRRQPPNGTTITSAAAARGGRQLDCWRPADESKRAWFG